MPVQCAAIWTLRVATNRHIVGDGGVFNRDECGVLVDGNLAVASACLSFVGPARSVALGVWEKLTSDRVATEADTVILKTSVAPVVTLAKGDALLDGRVLRIETCCSVNQGWFGVSSIRVAATVGERSEIRA